MVVLLILIRTQKGGKPQNKAGEKGEILCDHAADD